MADKKISQLTSATTPLAGTEVLPIVQGGNTVKVSAADVTTGRAISAASLSLTGSPLPVASGGTAQTSFTAGLVHFGSFSTDSNLFWDNSTKYLGIGGSAPYRLSVAEDKTITTTSGDGQIWVENSSVTTTNVGAILLSSQGNRRAQISGGKGTTGNDAFMAFTVRTDASGFVEMMRLDENSNVTVNAGNLVVGTAAKGIDFSANTGAAGETSSLLDWYEEGTFTPTIEGSSTAGTASYTVQTGAYTRIGRLVYFQIYLVWASGTGTGDLRVGGLPFTSASNTLAYGGAFAPLFTAISMTASNYNVGAYILSSNTKMVFVQTPVGGGAASNIAYDAAGETMLIGQYFV